MNKRWDDKLSCWFVDMPATAVGRIYEQVQQENGHDRWRDICGVSAAESVKLLKYGDKEGLKRVKDFYSKLKRSFKVRTPGKEFQNVVAGGMVRVPQFLLNNPQCFNRPVIDNNPKGAIKLYLNLSVSSWTSNENLVARGAAVMALAKCLSVTRPVEVVLYSTLRMARQDLMLRYALGTTPLNWGVLAAMTSPVGLRQASFHIGNSVAGYDGAIPWPRYCSYGEVPPKEYLGHDPDKDIVFGGLYDKCNRDAVGWVREQLEEIDGDLII